jgi:hypothetical protein
VNVGEPQQTVLLQGTGLERIESITSDSAVWSLASVASSARDLSQRKATLKLLPGVKKDEQFSIAMSVAGIQQPIQVPHAVQVLGPRPKIVSVNESFPEQADVSIHQGEIPAGSNISFAIRTEDIDARPAVALECSNDNSGAQPLSLRPGERNQTTSLDFVGANALFLSLDPGMVGQSGCVLTATVASQSGVSDPYTLGRIVRLPRIFRFSLADERVGSLYVGTLTGRDLQMIDKTGWDLRTGYPVMGIPAPLPGTSQDQLLKIELPWPPPAPRSPVYVWLRGETEGRLTKARY